METGIEGRDTHINKKYYEEILSVLDIKHLTNKNVEGNCLSCF